MLACPARAQVGVEVGSGFTLPSEGTFSDIYGIGYNVRGGLNYLLYDDIFLTLRLSYEHLPLDRGGLEERLQANQSEAGNLQGEDGRILAGNLGIKRDIDITETMHAYTTATVGVYDIRENEISYDSEGETFQQDVPSGLKPGAAFAGGIGTEVLPSVRLFLHAGINFVVSEDMIAYWPFGVMLSVGG